MATDDGRSPFKPRQLDDLRLLPTKDDPRPTFFWSAESPRDAGDLTRTTLYPRLLWHGETGVECTVTTAEDHQDKLSDGWVETQPYQAPTDPMAELQKELDALSPDDRAMVIEAQRMARLTALQTKIAALSEMSLQSLVSSPEERIEKRKPGRPRKTA
jgi:hypothetical protein